MNAIFRKLTTGVHFDTKKNIADAERFGLVKKKEAEPVKDRVELPTLNQVKEEVLARKRKHEDTNNDAEGDINILGNIKEINVKKKKKSQQKSEKEQVKDLMQEKINRFRNVNKIVVQGTDIPSPISEWKQLVDNYGVGETMFNNITYPRPTPIQMQTIPLMLQDREVLARAPTGSGKTAAFVIPLLHSLKAPKNGGYRALVLVPTKELAIQIEREFWKFCQGTGLRPHSLSKAKETKKLVVARHDILISPPNRLVYMLAHDPPLINLEKVEWLVVDEADKLFEAGDTGFREQLATIYKACSGPNIKRGMFSATLGEEVKEWCKLNFDNAVSVRVGALQAATDTIEQKLQYCGSEYGKLVAFRELVQKGITPPVLVFVQSKERAQELFRELLYDGIHVDVIHSDRSQLQRENTVRAFRSGGIWVLICTELMGRGIDFKGVSLVVNYDFPPSAVSYIHRIGRTGRAGRPGKAITYFTEEDKPLLRSIAQVMKNSGCDVPDFILKLKASKDAKKKLKNKAPNRQPVSMRVKNEIAKENEKKAKIEALKKKKKAKGTGIPKRKEIQNPENSEKPLIERKMKSSKTGTPAGYVASRIYKSFGGEKWKSNVMLTSMLCPGIVFAHFFVMNLVLWYYGSSAAIPFFTLVALLALWFGVSVPLTFVGAYFGFRKPCIEQPVRTNQIPRQIPDQSLYTQPIPGIIMGGVLPFGCIFIQLFFVLNSIWSSHIYYMYGFLFLVYLILIITCSETTILLCYFHLCAEDYHWWWRSFLTSGFTAFYLAMYCIHYFFTKLDIEGAASTFLYFGYTSIMVFCFFLLTGTIGFFASFWFVRKIYSVVKVD